MHAEKYDLHLGIQNNHVDPLPPFWNALLKLIVDIISPVLLFVVVGEYWIGIGLKKYRNKAEVKEHNENTQRLKKYTAYIG